MRAALVVVAIGIALAACGVVESPMFHFLASSFYDGESIPVQNTCDGADLSPHLGWADVPAGTAAFALIVRDPDAGGFVHWVLSDIPADVTELPEGRGDSIGMPGQNDFGRVGWGGPCPPSGQHRYEFTVYALSAPLDLDGAPTADEVDGALTGKVLRDARITGVYERQR